MGKENNNKTVIRIKVLPRSSKNQIFGIEDGFLKVKLTAPPVDGRANKALKELFADRLGVSRGKVVILSGERSRKKTIEIQGLSIEETNNLLDTDLISKG